MVLDPLTWEIITNYESQDLVRRRYSELHSRAASAEQAKSINAAFAQGRSYFMSALSADRNIRPLLLYYGVLGLARGTVLMLEKYSRESTLSPSHGLSEVDWKNTLSQHQGDVGSLAIRINKKGTFSEFISATKNITILRMLASGHPCGEYTHKNLLSNVIVSFDEIVSRIPDLASAYVKWNSSQNFLFPVNVQNVADKGCLNFYFHRSSSIDLIHRVFVNQNIEKNELDSTLITISISNTDAQPARWDYVRRGRGAVYDGPGTHLIAPFSSGVDFSKAGAIFILSYFLGMLSRYFPMRWSSLMKNEGGDAAYPTILASMDLIERDFPWMVANHLERNTP